MVVCTCVCTVKPKYKCALVCTQLKHHMLMLKNKGEPIPLFSDTFDIKYRAKNFTDTDTNSYSYTVACISHQMSYRITGNSRDRKHSRILYVKSISEKTFAS